MARKGKEADVQVFVKTEEEWTKLLEPEVLVIIEIYSNNFTIVSKDNSIGLNTIASAKSSVLTSSLLSGSSNGGGRVLGVGGTLQCHGQLPKEDQAGGWGRGAAVRHGQL